MELELLRVYLDDGTNGDLYLADELLCHTIELPWQENEKRVSCIPEGRYELKKRFSQKYGWHLLVMDVPDRACILIHPANDAQKELRGCIAPVTSLTGNGKGSASRKAFTRIKSQVYAELENDTPVHIIIKSKSF